MRKYLVLLLVAAVALIAVPAMAQAPAAPEKSVNFFAEVWFATYWDKKDKNASGKTDATGQPANGYLTGQWSVDETVTRFGARFKQGAMSGAVILNAQTNKAAASTTAMSEEYREWWGEYDFGAFKFMFGHAYTITYNFAYMQARGGQNAFAGSTTFTSQRSDHMKVTVPLGAAGSLAVALVEPFVDAPDSTLPTAAKGADITADRNFVMPKVEGLYNFVMKQDTMLIDIKVFGGYQKQDYYQSNKTVKATDVKAMAYGVQGTFGFGPVTVKGSFGMMKNGKEYGETAVIFASYYDSTANKLYETDTMMAHVAAGFMINPMFTIQAGYGMNSCELKVESVKYTQTKSEFYVNAPITVNSALTIQPEFCSQDYGKLKTSPGTSVKKGKNTYYGVEWIYRF